jgi:LDH2 family malate/lactate/ureidoglycolate dehydrogenase
MADLSVAAVPEGKVRMARDRHEQLPMGAILNKEGTPSADPNDFYDGGMLQFLGGHKGYSLALLVEVLAGCLSGAYGYSGQDRGNGLFFLAIAPGAFGARSVFAGRLETLCGRIKSVPPAPGFSAVLLPGEPEMTARRFRLAHGIDVPADSWLALKTLAAEFGVNAERATA